MVYAVFSFFPIVIAFVVFVVINWTRQPKLPNHLLGNHVSYVPHLLSPEQSEGLRRIALDEIRSFDNIAKDNKFYKSEHEHIGEALPIGADGKCSHPFLVPSSNRTE